MFSINKTRNVVLHLLNKQNNGYITPEEFNSYCSLAIANLYEDLFWRYNSWINRQNKRLTGGEYADIPKNLREQIDLYARYTDNTNFTYNSTTDRWNYTGTDFYRAENLSLVEAATEKRIDIDEVQKRELNVLNNSTLNAPSMLFPVYVKDELGYKVVPTVPTGYSVEMFFLRKYLEPKWTYNVVGGNPQYNATAPDLQDIDLHDSLFNEFIIKVLSYCGVSLREEQVIAAANNEEVMNMQQQQP